MFWFLILGWLISMPLLAQALKIDHVTTAGRDVRFMMQALVRAGLPSQYGGPHSNHATEMALTSFPDGSYLELIGIQPHADPAAVAAHYWHVAMESNSGPCAWAVRPANLAEEVERLRAASVAVTEPQRSSRLRPDGVRLDWETAQVGAGNGVFFPFLIRDITPHDQRAFPSAKPTTTAYAGISKVVLGVKDLEAAIAQYRRAYGLPAPERVADADFGANLAWFRGTPVVLAAPFTAGSWLDVRVRRFGDAPCALILARGRKSAIAIKRGSNWFGKQVAWFDPSSLGWYLGIE